MSLVSLFSLNNACPDFSICMQYCVSVAGQGRVGEDRSVGRTLPFEHACRPVSQAAINGPDPVAAV